MANMDLDKVYKAIATYLMGEGNVELYGIRNALIRAMEADALIYVLTRKQEVDGAMRSSFVLMNDGSGNVVFPLFTDLHELMSVKRVMEGMDTRLDVGIMELKQVLTLLVESGLCDGVVVDPDSLRFNIPLAFYADVLQASLSSHVTLIHADITDLCTDAIVSSTDQYLSGTTGVDAAIRQKGGSELREAVQDVELGIADVLRVEAAGELCSEYVLLTRAPVYSENMSQQALYDCYYNCMNVAQQSGCESIAFPCIGAGGHGVPMPMVMEISTAAVTSWMAEHPDYVIDVYFCCYEDGYKEMYQAFFDSLAQ